MTQNSPVSSRVVVDLKSGKRFATFWKPCTPGGPALHLADLFSGQVITRIVGTEDQLKPHEIDRAFTEATRSPDGNPYRRITFQRRVPTVTPKKRSLLIGAARVADQLEGLSLERVDDIIDNPADTWDGWNGATVYSDGEFKVVVGEPWDDTDCIMHVSRDNQPAQDSSPAPDPTVDRRRSPGRKTDRRRPVPTTVGEFVERVKEYGFEVDESRRHYGLTHPDSPGAHGALPRTPSDHRWADNQVTQIKQTFGIDIRQPLD